MGGACAALISIIEYNHMLHITEAVDPAGSGKMIIILAGLIIGSVSFAGSMIAYGKLEGKINDFNLPAQQVVNIGLVLGIAVLSGLFVMDIVTGPFWFYVILTLSVFMDYYLFSNWRSRYAGGHLFVEFIYWCCCGMWRISL